MSVRNIVSDDELDTSIRRKPRMHLSAYTFFYREERIRILTVLNSDDDFQRIQHIDPDLSEEIITKFRESGEIEFANLTRLIVNRWRRLNEQRKTYYFSVAARDRIRLQAEREFHNHMVQGTRVEDDG